VTYGWTYDEQGNVTEATVGGVGWSTQAFGL